MRRATTYNRPCLKAYPLRSGYGSRAGLGSVTYLDGVPSIIRASLHSEPAPFLWRSDVPTPWMRFVIRAPVGERLVSFCSEIGAESVSDGLEALLQAWKEIARAEVKSDA